MVNFRFFVIAALGSLALFGCSAIANSNSPSVAQQPQPNAVQNSSTQNYPKGTGRIANSDRSFLTQSAQDSLLEFATAQTAVQKATNPQIVQYSLRLMNDHAQYNQRLMLLAREKGITLPVELDQQGRSKLSQLTKLQGTAFDRKYSRETQQANNDDVNRLQREIKATQDSSVRTFIDAALPIQQQHQQLANALEGNSQSTRPIGQ